MSKTKRNKTSRASGPGPLERRGISVVCPVCGVRAGVLCHGKDVHEERSRRAQVFADMRADGIRAQERVRHFAVRAKKRRPPARPPAPVVIKHVDELSPVERARYGL